VACKKCETYLHKWRDKEIGTSKCHKTAGRHNEEQHDLYSSPHILQVIKPWKMRWVKHVAHMAERKKVPE
jgi:hypothetical protein